MPVLWLVDFDGRRLEVAFSLLPSHSSTNLIVGIKRTTTLDSLISDVQRCVREPVNLVRIVSHGDSGQLLFSSGTVNAANVRMFHFLRGLIRQPSLFGIPGIELHGCGVASDFLPPPRIEHGIGNAVTLNYGNMQGYLAGWGNLEDTLRGSRGVLFLLSMANVCGVCVKGGVDYQNPDPLWRYEGPTITVCPDPSRQVRLEDPQNRFGLGQLFNLRI